MSTRQMPLVVREVSKGMLAGDTGGQRRLEVHVQMYVVLVDGDKSPFTHRALNITNNLVERRGTKGAVNPADACLEGSFNMVFCNCD